MVFLKEGEIINSIYLGKIQISLQSQIEKKKSKKLKEQIHYFIQGENGRKEFNHQIYTQLGRQNIK